MENSLRLMRIVKMLICVKANKTFGGFKDYAYLCKCN